MMRINSTSIKPMMMKGMSLPTMSSLGLSGVTSNCSMVPISFSLTMLRAVRLVVTMSSIIQMTPGTIKSALERSGLYHSRVRFSTRKVRPLSLLKLPRKSPALSAARSIFSMMSFDENFSEIIRA